jgi:hypothetical protein
MVTSMARGTERPIDWEMRWNFSGSCGTSLSLDEFLAQKEAAGVEFFAGKEPWLVGLHKLNWQTFFRVCTQEMDDLSQKAIKLVIEYCLEVLEEVEKKIRGKASLARLEAALDVQYAEKYENKVYHYRWALRHSVVKEAITRAMRNHFPSR